MNVKVAENAKVRKIVDELFKEETVLRINEKDHGLIVLKGARKVAVS